MWATLVVLGVWGGPVAEAGEPRRLRRQAMALLGECELGDLASCMDLAHIERFGHGVEVNLASAADRYYAGCLAGRARGCVGWSELVLNGDVEGEAAIAQDRLELVCSGWDGSYEALLPMDYLEGQSISTACILRGHRYYEAGDMLRAQQLYRKACVWDSLGCFSAAALQNASAEATALRLTAQACGLDEVNVVPTQVVVGRLEMESACGSLRDTGDLPEELGVRASEER